MTQTLSLSRRLMMTRPPAHYINLYTLGPRRPWPSVPAETGFDITHDAQTIYFTAASLLHTSVVICKIMYASCCSALLPACPDDN